MKAKVARTTPRVCDKLTPRNIAPSKQREVAKLAFKFWLDRGFQNGSPQDDWLRAQRAVCPRERLLA